MANIYPGVGHTWPSEKALPQKGHVIHWLVTCWKDNTILMVSKLKMQGWTLELKNIGMELWEIHKSWLGPGLEGKIIE